MKQKKFINIQHIREENTELRRSNTNSFEVDDHIQITEKFDGSNGCVAYDEETNKLAVFSRNKELNELNTLNGFYNFVQLFDDETINEFAKNPNYRVFGEWSNRNKLTYYDTGKKKHWYVYDIYDVELNKYLTQDIVEDFCKNAKLEYINVLYDGKFISWEHCRSFLNKPHYGDKQEGIVVKLQEDKPIDDRNPHYLKIVNEDFRESMKTKEKIIDIDAENEKKKVREIVESVVTHNRVEKMLFKMRDDGILPNKVEPSDMKIVAQNLPKRIYEDCMKEEKEIVLNCGEHFGKMCQVISMSHARDILLGV